VSITIERRIACHLALNWHLLQRAEPDISDPIINGVAREIAVDLFGNPPKQKENDT